MDHFLCSAAVVICLALQVSSQLPAKPIGEWHPDRYQMYPNPYLDSSACKTTKTSGLCDYNEILTPEQREYFIEQPEIKAVGRKHHAPMRIMVTVVIMKKIGPQITDYKAASKDFAEKFRTAWNLTNYAVILIASKNDNMSFLDAGADVINQLSANVTDKIDEETCETYFMKGRFVEGINATLKDYRDALAVAAARTPAPTPALTTESGAHGGSSTIIIIIIIVVLIVVIGIIVIIIIVIRRKQKKDRGGISTGKPLSNLHEGNATEKAHLESAPRNV